MTETARVTRYSELMSLLVMGRLYNDYEFEISFYNKCPRSIWRPPSDLVPSFVVRI